MKARVQSTQTEDELKRELCKQIRRALFSEFRTLEQFAFRLGTSRAVLSYVVNDRTRKISFNQLMRFLIVLYPRVRILIAKD